MFKLVNRYGNAHKTAETEQKRDELLNAGFILATELDNGIELDRMTVAQLETFAGEKGISLDGCSNKTEKLARIKETIGN